MGVSEICGRSAGFRSGFGEPTFTPGRCRVPGESNINWRPPRSPSIGNGDYAASSTHCWISEGFRSNSRAASDALVLPRMMSLTSAALRLAVQRFTSLFSFIAYVLIQATIRGAGI